jgi:uncharacterized damage-inducible protein DinB
MLNQIAWIDRKFNLDFPVGIFPCIIERLRGTPIRVEQLVSNLSEELLNLKPDGIWSIKERVGHIADVEGIWETRLAQFMNSEEYMVAADMSNQKTENANHNEKTIDELLERLHNVRKSFIAKLVDLPEEVITRTALHPRLKTPMRLIDLTYFAAEHDDNEIALMRRIVNQHSK